MQSRSFSFTRRKLLLQGATAAAAPLLPPSLLRAFSVAPEALQPGPSSTDTVLSTGWEFYKGPLDARLQVWHSEELVTWEPVTVPHCVNAHDGCDPDWPAYRGQAWYRTQLAVANPFPNGRTLLHFEAAAQSASVYVGETLAGRHEGGYDEFVLDVTELCAKEAAGKPMRLSVLCDNGRDVERMPSDLSDFTLYGGLTRPVHLRYLPAVSVAVLHVHTEWEPGWPAAKVAVTARLHAPGTSQAQVAVSLRIFDPQGRVVGEKSLSRAAWTEEEELAEFTLQKPALWSPAGPQLYRCEVMLTQAGTSSTLSERFGVRHTRFEEHGPFYLNGERLPLRGTQRHEDHAGYAAAMPADLIREEMRLMKAMGANMVRLAHYQQSRLVLELCDELGLLVWEEIPWCRSGVVDEAFKAQGREKLTTLIDQHRNHPSVLIWGIGNEDDWPGEPNGNDHAALRAFMTELRDLAHRLDSTRMTGYRRADFAKDIPDVYSPSIWAGWYSGSYTEYKGALEKARGAVSHMLHVEWGADSHAGRHAEDADPVLANIMTGHGTAETGLAYKLNGGPNRVSKDGEWSETYACDLFDWYLKTQMELPWLTGSLQWVFKDFTTPLRVENPVPRVNQKGLLTRDMKPKEGYYVFQSYWAAEPMVRLYGHEWPVRWGKPGQKRMVRVYSNCPAVELFVNGISAGVRHRDPQDFPCAGLRWEVAFAAGTNTLRVTANGKGQQLSSDTVEFEYQTEPWGKPRTLQLRATERSEGQTTVEATLHDAAGVRCLDSRAVVRFSVAGPGTLVDNLGTPTGSRVVQLYNGRARIAIRHTAPVSAGVQCEDTKLGVTAALVPLG